MRLTRVTFPEEHATQLRDMILDVTGRAMGSGKNKVILRKLYVAVRTPPHHTELAYES